MERAARLDVHVGAAGTAASAVVRLAALPPLLPALEKAREQRKQGHLDEASADRGDPTGHSGDHSLLAGCAERVAYGETPPASDECTEH